MVKTSVFYLTSDITINNVVQTFLNEELLTASPQTQKWYRCRLGLFMSAIGIDRPITDISKMDLLTWWKNLDFRTRTVPPDLSIETFHGYVRAVRRIYKWLYEQNLIDIPLHLSLKLPHIPQRQRKGISDSNAMTLITAASENQRDLAILLFLESTGARRGGVASLTLDDLSVMAPEPYCRRVTLHEKGEKIRTVIMSSYALVAMRAWLAVRKSKTDYVFVDERPGRDSGLQPGAINQLIARYKRLAGIKGACSPHQWRHHFCRARLKEKMPLNIVSQLAGHSTVVVTAMFYGNLLVDELQNAYDECYKPLSE